IRVDEKSEERKRQYDRQMRRAHLNRWGLACLPRLHATLRLTKVAHATALLPCALMPRAKRVRVPAASLQVAPAAIPVSRPSLKSLVAGGLLLAFFLVQSFSVSLRKSPVFDEPAHIAAGLSYLATGSFVANAQHPPLLKELAAFSLRIAGVRW